MKRLLALAAAVVALAAGCGGDDDRPAEVVLVTHDSFAVSKPVRRAFERETGLKLRVLQSGDAGAMLNRALLTAGDPEGDVLFGVDSSLLSRARRGPVRALRVARARARRARLPARRPAPGHPEARAYERLVGEQGDAAKVAKLVGKSEKLIAERIEPLRRAPHCGGGVGGGRRDPRRPRWRRPVLRSEAVVA